MSALPWRHRPAGGPPTLPHSDAVLVALRLAGRGSKGVHQNAGSSHGIPRIASLMRLIDSAGSGSLQRDSSAVALLALAGSRPGSGAIAPERAGKCSRAEAAGGEGFEPSVGFPLHTLSKRAPSTTRPSLRLKLWRRSSDLHWRARVESTVYRKGAGRSTPDADGIVAWSSAAFMIISIRASLAGCSRA